MFFLCQRILTKQAIVFLSLSAILLMAVTTLLFWEADEGQDFITNLPQVKKVAYATKWFSLTWPWEDYGWKAFSECEERRCVMTKSKKNADALIFHASDLDLRRMKKRERNPNQVWVYFNLESPFLDKVQPSSLNGMFNWTATYRSYSEVHVPYATVQKNNHKKVVQRDYGLGKSKLAFILSSHCSSVPSKRWEMVADLQKYIPVDVYGKCGGQACTGDCNLQSLAAKYKFYLAFENACCAEYVTEKLWKNAFENDLVPIVLGGRDKSDFARLAPPNSFIFAGDFRTPKELAEYISNVATDNQLYNSYFRWKSSYSVYFGQEVELPCALCKALHNQTLVSERRTVERMDVLRNITAECLNGGSERNIVSSNIFLVSLYLAFIS